MPKKHTQSVSHHDLPAPVYRDIIAARVLTLRNQGKKLKRAPRILPPDPAEKAYRASLLAIMGDLKALVRARIIPLLAGFAKQADHSVPKQDAWADDFQTSFDGIKFVFARQYTQDELEALALKTGTSVSEWNRRQNAGMIQRVLDVNVVAEEPWLQDRLNAFVVQNVHLIEGLTDSELNQVQTLAMQGLVAGTSIEDISDEILSRFDDVSESRAELIARDQVSKLNGQLTELRQQDMGIKGYIWRGVMDDRERESHLANEGEHFDWDDAPAETGHPGDDICCRCWAEPDFETVDTEQ